MWRQILEKGKKGFYFFKKVNTIVAEHWYLCSVKHNGHSPFPLPLQTPGVWDHQETSIIVRCWTSTLGRIEKLTTTISVSCYWDGGEEESRLQEASSYFFFLLAPPLPASCIHTALHNWVSYSQLSDIPTKYRRVRCWVINKKIVSLVKGRWDVMKWGGL